MLRLPVLALRDHHFASSSLGLNGGQLSLRYTALNPNGFNSPFFTKNSIVSPSRALRKVNSLLSSLLPVALISFGWSSTSVLTTIPNSGRIPSSSSLNSQRSRYGLTAVSSTPYRLAHGTATG